MADPITETDDDLEVVEVEQLPKPGETPPAAAAAEDEDEAPAEDEEDARLVADDEDEDEADATDKDSPAHKKRVKRRQIQKQARDRTLAELSTLREQNADFARQLSEIRGNQLSQSESQIDERLVKTRDDISLAERILAKAVEAGNGDDVTAALRLRDDAKAQESELLRSKGSVTKVRENAPDPVVVRLANEWKTANAAWYNVNMEATAIANRIDGQVKLDGFPPNTSSYWQELSRRLEQQWQKPADQTAQPAKKKVPPQGQTREHVPNSTRREVYVTPERKQAMVDAGIWDDPTRRTKMLKAYADFDRDQSAS